MEYRYGIISGGTDGIGLACAQLLSKKNYKVLIFGRHIDKLSNALATLPKNALGILADVSNPSDLERIFEFFDDNFPRLDFLINNASIGSRSILNNSIDQIKKVIEINLEGYLMASKLAIERMRHDGSGHIINIGSLSSQTRDSDTDLYVAAKSAIEGFSDSLRKKIDPLGIKLTLIRPGGTGTGMISESEQEKEELEEKYLLLKPEDVAEAVLFSLSMPARVEIMDISIKARNQIL